MSGIETVQKILVNILKDLNYNDSSVDIQPVSTGGANYTSELYNITVVDKHKDTLHLFAKVAIVGSNVREEIGNTIFVTEDFAYRKIAIAANEIQDKYEIPKEERFVFAKFYGSNLEFGNETFVLENLRLKGYQLFSRFDSIDYQSIFDTVTALAKFNAFGLVLDKERPELYKELESAELLPIFDNLVKNARHAAPNYIKALDEQYHEKLQKYLQNDIYDTFKQLYTRKGKFLIHGDFRASNIMYKKENDKVLIVPVDYQSVRLGSPITDLLNFVTTSTDAALRVKHFEELVEHYYTQLSLYLSKLDIDVNDVYPKQMFQDELKELLPATLLMALVLYPLFTVDPDDAPIMTEEENGVNSLFVKPTAKSNEKVIGYVKDCIRWGILQ